jgi:hypothetical protein
VNLVHYDRFDQLGSRKRRRNLENGLAGEYRGALRNGTDVPAESEIQQPVQKLIGEPTDRPQVFDRRYVEAETLQVIQNDVSAACKKEISVGREPPNEERKDGPIEHALFKVCLEHGQLVEIREKGICSSRP